ncbi:MAG: hypothetical protein ACREX9_11030 [Gammaproteobacteria bacterium]
MSKTVMRVMMIGLVAMLGAKAEAHYFIVGGKAKYCSICVDVKLIYEDVPPPHTEELEFVATIPQEKAEILCLDGTVKKSTDEVVLRVRKLIGQGDITEAQLGTDSATTAEVEAIVSDAAFLTKKINKFNVCPDFSPVDVLVRAVNLKIISNQCTSTPCKPVSSLEAVCTLSDKFDLKNYPKKLPPIETRYDCSNATITP